MSIILKFQKSITDRTKRPGRPHAARGPRVWDPWCRATIFCKTQWTLESEKFV